MSDVLALSPRERMWRAGRCLQVFGVEDLFTVGTTTRAEALAFVKCLTRRGYIKLEGREVRARRGRPLAKFRLIQNPGPQLPAELRSLADRRLA